MMHLQDRITAHMQQRLEAAGIVKPGRVVREGVDQVPAESTPAIRIDIGPESVVNLTLKAPRTQKRTLDVFITVVVAQNDDFRRSAGSLLASVERVFATPAEPCEISGINTESLQLVATDPDRDGNAASVVYSIRSLWRITYLCKEGAPDQALGRA